jgi:hypothetical protein
MRIQEALEVFENVRPQGNRIINEALNTIKTAVKKQMPKKPISFKRTAHDFQNGFCKHSGNYCEYIKPYNHEYKYTDYKCPCCEHIISDGTPSHCWNCGQALDWSDNNA